MDKNLGAGDESRTRDLNLGKVALYQLSYSRILVTPVSGTKEKNYSRIFSGCATVTMLRAPGA
jgi:hypothetical protein